MWAAVYGRPSSASTEGRRSRTLKANAIAAEALLRPLMAVQTQLQGIRQIGADFEKRRPPLTIVYVEVIVVDGHRLPREFEHGGPAVALPFVRLERPHLLLRHADDHDPFAGRIGADAKGASRSYSRDDRMP